MKTYITDLEISSPFLTDYYIIEYKAIQTDSKGQPLMKIKFNGKIPFSKQSAIWFKDRFKSKSL